MQEIKRKGRTERRKFGGIYAAACAAAILLVGTILFNDEVHAMIRQISFSIGNALEISSDLAEYREVVGTSITDEEYIVTLQEAIAAEGKLIVSYTIERADGTDLAADTKRIQIGKVFELPDGVKVTLNEFTTNELEQRITYSLSAQTDYILKVKATDSAGKQAEFGVRGQGPESGYMQSEKMIEDGSVYDGRLEESAESADMTLYAVKLPKENGAVREEYAQVGESFLVEF